MTIGIFGAGRIGYNLGTLAAAAGERVLIAGSGSAAETTAKLGAIPHGMEVVSTDRVANGDLLMIAVPWTALDAVWRHADALAGKIVLDVTNPYNATFTGIENLGGKRSSAIVVAHLPGARVVKAVNTLGFQHLIDDARPAGDPARIALPVAGDDAEAKAAIIALLDRMGFTGLDAGTIADSGAQEPEGPLYNKAWTETELREALATLRGDLVHV